jgi:hypothetical protein
MKKILLTVLSFYILCMVVQPALSAPIISIEPSNQNVQQGDLFTVDITIDPQGFEVLGGQYYLYFNNTILNVTEQIPGDFLSQDGADTIVMPNNINNTIGFTEYGETRIGVTSGVTEYGVLASVTFQAIGSGITHLNLSNVVLSDTSAQEIPDVIVNNATVDITETHFIISGVVDYNNGDPILGPNVIVTNLNTDEVFIADVNDSSNYYQVSTNFVHISSDDILHFNVNDNLGNISEFNHTVTQNEMDTGGFVKNTIIHIPDTTPPIITNISAIEITKDSAIISWDTDELSDSLVKYGTSPGNYNQTVYSSENLIHHSINLSELSINTTYYYVINSTDLSDNSAQSIECDFKTFPEIIVIIGETSAMTGSNATLSIIITNITNVGTTDIILTFNQSIVHVVDASKSDFDFMDTEIDNANGRTRIGAFQTSSDGLSGNVRVANITFNAVGGGGDSTVLGLVINELKEESSQEIPIPASVQNGTFTVWETSPPIIINPLSDPSSIPEDTDADPGWGETSQLSVVVTDECGVADVTINLSTISGLSDQSMARITDTDIWTVTVSASIGTALFNESYLPHNLTICAIDAFGNVNSSVSIPLTVILNGDVSNNGEVSLYDATYLANYILNKPGFETMNERVGDVSGNGAVTFYDAMYLSKHVLTDIEYEILH